MYPQVQPAICRFNPRAMEPISGPEEREKPVLFVCASKQRTQAVPNSNFPSELDVGVNGTNFYPSGHLYGSRFGAKCLGRPLKILFNVCTWISAFS